MNGNKAPNEHIERVLVEVFRKAAIRIQRTQRRG